MIETPDKVFERFKETTKDHQLTIIKDDGVYRHIKLARPDTICESFHIHTWPGYLCYCGDMGDYLFHRLEDMFQFFRASESRPFPSINPSYWQEKLQAPDGRSVAEFCRESYDECARNDLEQFLSELPEGLDPTEIKQQFQEEILDHPDEYDGELAAFEAVKRMVEFCIYLPDPERDRKTGAESLLARLGNRQAIHPFDDFYECDLSIRQYSYHYLWACYAIQWAIGKYDAAKPDTNGDG